MFVLFIVHVKLYQLRGYFKISFVSIDLKKKNVHKKMGDYNEDCNQTEMLPFPWSQIVHLINALILLVQAVILSLILFPREIDKWSTWVWINVQTAYVIPLHCCVFKHLSAFSSQTNL